MKKDGGGGCLYIYKERKVPIREREREGEGEGEKGEGGTASSVLVGSSSVLRYLLAQEKDVNAKVQKF